MKRVWYSLAIILLGIPHASWSAYTSNHESTISWIKLYNSDTIYFALVGQPSTPCAENYFVLSPSLTDTVLTLDSHLVARPSEQR